MSANGTTVSRVARMASVTVRTLHHYDEIGLLTPSGRSTAGYRLYADTDLRRLHQILLFRELGFSLEAIGRLLDDPAYDRATALRAQRDLLTDRMKETGAILRAVDTALDAIEEGRDMDASELFEGFDGFDHAQYREEAEQRWGETEAYKESMRRSKAYTKADWARIQGEGETTVTAMAALLAAGRAPESPEAMDAAEGARLHIERWFYPCSRAMHVGLADMYEADPRFRQTYESRAQGLAAFVAGAIRANAARHEPS
jgi:DNA-binding transcriptional MerR regulator